jgi:hypothetical protein
MSLHVYILPLFWINQSLVFLINMMCLEKKNAPTMLLIYIVKSDKSRVGDVFIQYKY